MAIPISAVKQKCCDNDLSSFTIIDGDTLDQNGSTCDKIIECADKYILVEEKSLLLSFCDLCCREVGHNLESYKYNENNVIYLRITDVIKLIQPMDENIKKRILAEMTSSMLATSLNKVSNTTHILSTDCKFDKNKAKNMKTLYLYCKSGKPIDIIMATWLSRNQKTPFIECATLKMRLQANC